MSDIFYTIGSDSALRGTPWMGGSYCDHVLPRCPVCRASIGFPTESIRLRPETHKGTFWPDAVGCGDGSGDYFSLAVKQGFDEMGFRYGEAVPATVVPAYPKKMPDEPPPYFYLTGEMGADFDFEGAGHRVISICPSCGVVKKDPTARPTRAQFKPGTWNGADFFYTALSRNVKFCTRAVLELAARKKWRGLRFVSLERAYDASFRGLDYLHGEF